VVDRHVVLDLVARDEAELAVRALVDAHATSVAPPAADPKDTPRAAGASPHRSRDLDVTDGTTRVAAHVGPRARGRARNGHL
jgi:hypothetical protein